MTTTSTVAKDVPEARKAILETSGDIQSDLQTLRNEFQRLAAQVNNIVADKGSAAWQRARPSVEGAVSDAQEKGREVIDAARDVTDNFIDAIDKSIKNRPYTTLALLAVVGFVVGATWRR